MLTWLAGPSKGLLLISRQEGYLPPFLQRLNKNGVQQNILVVQGLVTTVIGLAYALIPDVSSAYWIFSVITTQVYLIMYLLMFVAAVQLRRKRPGPPARLPRPDAGRPVRRRLRGLAGRPAGRVHPAVAVRVAATPASTSLIVGGGALGLGLLVPFLFYRFRKPSWKQPERRGGDVVMSTQQENQTTARADVDLHRRRS